MQTVLIEETDHEPTLDQLDADIKKGGLDEIVEMMPAGSAWEGLREMLRTNMRWARYQKKTVLEDVIPIEVDGKFGFINPHLDTGWNFARVMDFLNKIFAECSRLL